MRTAAIGMPQGQFCTFNLMRAGITSFLAKPVHDAHLLALMGALLGERAPRPKTPGVVAQPEATAPPPRQVEAGRVEADRVEAEPDALLLALARYGVSAPAE